MVLSKRQGVCHLTATGKVRRDEGKENPRGLHSVPPLPPPPPSPSPLPSSLSNTTTRTRLVLVSSIPITLVCCVCCVCLKCALLLLSSQEYRSLCSPYVR